MISGDERKAFELEEYKQLRAEILITQQLSTQNAIATISAICLLLGIWYSKKDDIDPAFLLIPILLILPCMINTIHKSVDIIKIGAYIQVFFGESNNINEWEKRQHIITHHKGSISKKVLIPPWLYTPFLWLGIACLALFIYTIWSKNELFSVVGLVRLVATLLLAVALVMVTIKLHKIKRCRKEFLTVYRKLLKFENEYITVKNNDDISEIFVEDENDGKCNSTCFDEQ
ncbi:MAG: hypothetical protein WCJ56_08655 [bacterium]